MGARLLLAGLPTVATKCSKNAQLAYVVMATVARDSAGDRMQAGLYFGGHARILATLGRLPSASSLRHLRYALQELTEAGVITLASKAVPGRHAVYRINVDPDAVDNSGLEYPPEPP